MEITAEEKQMKLGSLEMVLANFGIEGSKSIH